ncbi:MAG: hypothetical protein A2622_07325 [Bdellovibrionales bacterium RIFCSPHIGHO2_01_FULL_40_29]|nr:MAG: hypothetical protein A2622_07325 [Bdellovibrionales bacterium RIFCSPHIGHO2_01_FULL_40_29]OFZ33194.1 MAG: hypothetical protein A3D17_11455 [Bdellovibrionales bacterium RIFCSPHIGHO2_02_FULL_40_15]
MKTILFLVLLGSLNVQSFGRPRGTEKCVLATLTKDQLHQKNENLCEVTDILLNKKKIDYAKFNPCPRPFKNKYVFIKSNFMHVDENNKLMSDNIEITNKKTCATKELSEILSGNSFHNKFQRTILNINKDTPLIRLTNLNFFKIRSTGLVWTYHLTPGISADVEITGVMCGKKVCLDEKKQKISNVLKIYKDFIMMDDKDQIYYSSALDNVDK